MMGLVCSYRVVCGVCVGLVEESGVIVSFQHLLYHCFVCDILAIHLKSFRFLACWRLGIPWYGVHFQCSGCAVPRAYICLKMFVIMRVIVYGRALSSSGATLLGSVALPVLICAFALVEL